MFFSGVDLWRAYIPPNVFIFSDEEVANSVFFLFLLLFRVTRLTVLRTRGDRAQATQWDQAVSSVLVASPQEVGEHPAIRAHVLPEEELDSHEFLSVRRQVRLCSMK